MEKHHNSKNISIQRFDFLRFRSIHYKYCSNYDTKLDGTTSSGTRRRTRCGHGNVGFELGTPHENYSWLLIKIPLSRNGHSSRIKKFTFAKLSRTPCLSFAGPMLANNTSYEDSFTTCQITPENHGSLLGSLLNMQLASRSPFSGQILFCKVYWPTPFNMHFDFRPLFRITFAELSRKYPYSQTPAISRCTEGKAKTRGLGVWLSQSLTFGNLATATRILWCPSPAGPRAAVGGSPLHIMIIIPNFRETFAK